jgi:hypothetical protein
MIRVLLCAVAIATGVPPETPLTIFIGPHTRDGFVDMDRGVLDSIRDLKAELRGKKCLRVVAEKGQADLILEVVSRGATSDTGGGTAAIPIGATTMYLPIGTNGLTTRLRAGAYEKPIVFQNCEAWRLCARLVVKDLEAWIDANAAAIERKPENRRWCEPSSERHSAHQTRR